MKNMGGGLFLLNQTCQGPEIFKGEIFTFGNFLKVPPHHGWGANKILISRTSIFAFLLGNFKNKK